MLQNQQIPRHLLGEAARTPTLHITFSPHADLPVTAQSYCTRCGLGRRLGAEA